MMKKLIIIITMVSKNITARSDNKSYALHSLLLVRATPNRGVKAAATSLQAMRCVNRPAEYPRHNYNYNYNYSNKLITKKISILYILWKDDLNKR